MNGWLTAVKGVGFPIFVALILLGVLTGTIPWPLGAIQASHATIQREIEEHIQHDAVALRILRQVCINTASNPEALRACVE